MSSKRPSIQSRFPQTAASLFTLALALAANFRSGATGLDLSPSEYLAEGGRRVDASPEFYWEDELKRLAKDYRPTEKWTPPKESDPGTPDAQPPAHADLLTIDLEEFAAALKEGRIKPPDPALAKKQHEAARVAIDGADKDADEPLPAEFASEFADYHRGAYAYERGQEHWEEARQAWEKLLQRPREERTYRSVWAAFMLGRMAMKLGDASAPGWFQRTRALAKDGCTDPLEMAADSYGWEARSEWKSGHPEKAAPLYLTQLALGDETAIVSLKALIPDRTPVEGWLNYGPELEEIQAWTDEQKKAAEEKSKKLLAAAARDPLLRRLVTAHILAIATNRTFYPDEAAGPDVRSKHWLATINALKLKSVADAEYLGWAAYNVGDYAGAARWLALAENSEAPAASWLRSKLQRRAGKMDEAARSMEQAWKGLEKPNAYFGWEPPGGGAPEEEGDESPWSLRTEAGGDLAALHLAQAEFLQALETFRQGGLGADAVYLAERVLTADELKKYVDQLPIPVPSPTAPGNHLDWRYLLGRRLVREDRYEEAAGYLPEMYRQVLQIYGQALRDGADEKLPAGERARAWFHAAWIARRDGMELMGTQEAPDSFNSDGSFEATDLAGDRTRGSVKTLSFQTGKPLPLVQPVLPKPTKEELRRLTLNKIRPDIRFHYRVIAGALAMKAAALLPDGTEELADVINTAGQWVKDRDNQVADRYYATLQKRAGKTELGKSAKAKRWFVEEAGPWSEREEQEHEAMMKKLEPKETGQ